jgi:hypothetical protein
MADDGTPDQPGPRRQVDVYAQGMAGVTPDRPVGFEELEARALETHDEDAYGYVAGAAGRTKSSARRTERGAVYGSSTGSPSSVRGAK